MKGNRMTYQELLREHAEVEGITMLNSYGHGHLLYKGEWFGDQFRHGTIEPELACEMFCDVITGESKQLDVSSLDL